MRSKLFQLILFCCLAWFSVACERASEEASVLPPEATLETTDIPSVPTLVPEPLEIQPLLFWLPDALVSSRDEVTRSMFEQFIRDFEDSGVDVLVNWRIKAADGVGGNLSTLRAASEVATAAIPDLMLLRQKELVLAANDGLIHAWPDVPTELVADIPSTAMIGGELNGIRYGLPYSLTLNHLVLDKNAAVTLEEEDYSFAAILERELTLALPLEDNMQMRELLLSQLMAAEDGLEENPTLPDLLSALEELFAFYEFAFSMGLIVPFEEDGQSASAWLATSDEYLRSLASDESLGFAPIPNRSGSELALVDAWYWVLPNAERGRQQIAVEFVLWMMDEARQDSYLSAVGSLPARQSSLAAQATNEYRSFVQAAVSKAERKMSIGDPLAALIYRNFVDLSRGEISTEAALGAIESQYHPNP